MYGMRTLGWQAILTCLLCLCATTYTCFCQKFYIGATCMSGQSKTSGPFFSQQLDKCQDAIKSYMAGASSVAAGCSRCFGTAQHHHRRNWPDMYILSSSIFSHAMHPKMLSEYEMLQLNLWMLQMSGRPEGLDGTSAHSWLLLIVKPWQHSWQSVCCRIWADEGCMELP